MAVIVVYNPQLTYMLKGQGGLVDRDMRRRAIVVQGAARASVGVRTGVLKASIHTRRTLRATGFQYEVGSAVKYALTHHEGAAPHIIIANRAQTLRFTSGGRVVYARTVAHPGTRANRYLKDNLYLALV